MAHVELVRCVACGRSSWQLDGAEVSRGAALAALSAAFTSPPRPARPRSQAPRPVPTVAPPADLTALLAGWQVLGSR